MPDNKPTHDQARLQLQLYDLRREAKLRQAREWFTQNYFVDSMEDSNRIAPPGSQEGTYVMMVLTYWDQAWRRSSLRSGWKKCRLARWRPCASTPSKCVQPRPRRLPHSIARFFSLSVCRAFRVTFPIFVGHSSLP